MIWEISWEVTNSNIEKIESFQQLIKKLKLSIKNKKPDLPLRKIKNKPSTYTYLPFSIENSQFLDSIKIKVEYFDLRKAISDKSFSSFDFDTTINQDIVSSFEVNH